MAKSNGFELIQMFDALSITDEVERKRSRESDDLFVDPHDGFFNSSNISLISNENISSNDQVADADYSSNNNIVTLESSTDSIQIDESEAFTFSIDKSLTSKDLLLISLGIDNSFITHEVDLPPLNIPHLKGNYLYIVKAQNVKNLGDVVSVDKLSPWNNQKKGVRSKQYYVDFEVQENNIKKYTRSDSKNRDAFKNYTFEWQTNHHELPVNKKIIAVCQPNDKKPIENTKVCFYYEVKQDTPAIEKLSEKIHNPRLAPSDSAKIKQFLLNKHTPTAALHKHQQTSSLMDAVSTVTQSQVSTNFTKKNDRVYLL
uniref:Uncharacterized protein n=1 Tax=Panagrolaimus davidi TaxID=227884 RepID=A0A914PPT9_9BILA